MPRSSAQRAHLEIAGDLIEIRTRVNPRARRMIIKVEPASGAVVVVVPSKRVLASALEFARRQQNWIAGQLKRVPARVLFQDGAVIPLRGVPHTIMYQQTARIAGQILSDPPRIVIGGDPDSIGRRVENLLKRNARADLGERVTFYAHRLDVHPRRISLRDTQSRWGSCSSSRTLSFSWRLILAPPSVLAYVAAHEVAHLREMNHSPAFWAQVRSQVADIETPQAWLAHNGAGLHRFIAG